MARQKVSLTSFPTPCATEALRLARDGIPVVALAPGSKKPRRGSRGVSEATTLVGNITLWWSNHPDANLGLACGHQFDVIDIDPRSGGRFPVGQTLPIHAMVRTPSGGWHLYVPVGLLSDRTLHKPGWDYQARGAYVVAPPSPGYEWVVGWSSEAQLVSFESRLV